MAEILISIGLIGLGYILNKDGKKNRLIINKYPENNLKQNNIYNSNLSQKIKQHEENLVKERNRLSQNPSVNKVIPMNYNKNIINTPIKNDAIISKLSGQKITKENFSHSNMTPFFGSNIKQNTDNSTYGTVLEKYTGSNENFKNKTEVNRMFDLKRNVSYPNGSPNSNVHNRYKTSRFRQNELPIDQIKVGPGVNDPFGTEGQGGFHQLDIQEIMKPKTVDELRPINKPKLTYEGRVLSGLKESKRGLLPHMQKNRPDKFYKNTPDRYFKTTGAVLKSKLREKCYAKPTKKQTLRSYTGQAAPAVNIKPYKTGLYKKSKRNTYVNSGLRNAGNKDKWSYNKSNADYGKNTIKLPTNERDITQKRTHLTNFASAVKALIAPIEDIIKTTKKENFIGNERPTGNLSMPTPNKMTVYDPNDVARTTIKETSIHNERDGNIVGLKKLTVYDPNDVARTTIKETNIHNEREGHLIGNKKQTVYDPNDVARTTIKETNIHNEHDGHLTGVKKQTAYDPNDVARTTIKETNIDNNHEGHLSGIHKQTAYDPNDLARTTIKETNIHNDRDGNIGGVKKQTAYDPNDVARTTIKETNIHNDRDGNIGGVKKLTVYDPNDIAKTTIKETNIHNNRKGDLTGPRRLIVYDPNDIARTTIKETNIHNNRRARPYLNNKGQVYEHDTLPKVTGRNTLKNKDNNVNLSAQSPPKTKAYDPNDTAKTTMKETTLFGNQGNIERQTDDGYLIAPAEAPNTHKQFLSDNEYTGNPEMQAGTGGGKGYLVANVKAPNTNKQFLSDNEYMGGADSINNKPISYDDAYNASLNINKEEISVGREPTKTSVKLNAGQDVINMEIRKLEKDIINNRVPQQNRMYTDTTRIDSCSVTTPRNPISNEYNTTRIEPEILDTFKKNPYTQPLDSYGSSKGC